MAREVQILRRLVSNNNVLRAGTNVMRKFILEKRRTNGLNKISEGGAGYRQYLHFVFQRKQKLGIFIGFRRGQTRLA